jgi:hypothetical protein
MDETCPVSTEGWTEGRGGGGPWARSRASGAACAGSPPGRARCSPSGPSTRGWMSCPNAAVRAQTARSAHKPHDLRRDELRTPPARAPGGVWRGAGARPSNRASTSRSPGSTPSGFAKPAPPFEPFIAPPSNTPRGLWDSPTGLRKCPRPAPVSARGARPRELQRRGRGGLAWGAAQRIGGLGAPPPPGPAPLLPGGGGTWGAHERTG